MFFSKYRLLYNFCVGSITSDAQSNDCVEDVFDLFGKLIMDDGLVEDFTTKIVEILKNQENAVEIIACGINKLAKEHIDELMFTEILFKFAQQLNVEYPDLAHAKNFVLFLKEMAKTNSEIVVSELSPGGQFHGFFMKCEVSNVQ